MLTLRNFLDLYGGGRKDLYLLSEDGMTSDKFVVDETVASVDAVDSAWLDGEVIYFDADANSLSVCVAI